MINLKNLVMEAKTPNELYLTTWGGRVYPLTVLDNIRDTLYNVQLQYKNGKTIKSTFFFGKEKDGKESNKFSGRFYTSKVNAKKDAMETIDKELKRIQDQADRDKKRWQTQKNNIKAL